VGNKAPYAEGWLPGIQGRGRGLRKGPFGKTVPGREGIGGWVGTGTESWRLARRSWKEGETPIVTKPE